MWKYIIRFLGIGYCFCLAYVLQAKIIGKLGQTLASQPIHLHPNLKSKTLYRAKAYEYLILKPCKQSGWISVVMQNGMLGYVQKEKVAELPYEVQQNQTQKQGTQNHSSSRSWIAHQSLHYVGSPYKFGGHDFKRGIDCSAFVQKMYGSIGFKLPRTAAEQALVGQAIHRLEDLKSGDRLYFWEKKRNKIGHTGMYLGNGFFVHASSGRKGIATDDLRNPKWKKLLVAARR